MVASVLALALPATAAGAVDNIVPTGTWNPTCQSGMTAYVVCQTDNAGVYYYMDSQGGTNWKHPTGKPWRPPSTRSTRPQT